jgi:hypothetical protein
VSGEVVEYGQHQLYRDGARYTFFTVKLDDGTFVKINDAAMNADSAFEVRIGNRATFYVRPIKDIWENVNIIVATESERGAYFFAYPAAPMIAINCVLLLVTSPLLYIIGFFTSGLLAHTLFGWNAAFAASTMPIWPGIYWIYRQLRQRRDATLQAAAIRKRNRSQPISPTMIVQNI